MNAFLGSARFKEYGDFIAFCGSDSGEGNACVATREVYNFSTWFQFACALGFFDHAEGSTILDRTCSVEIFELGENMALGVMVLFEIVEFKKRCMSNKFCNGMVDI